MSRGNVTDGIESDAEAKPDLFLIFLSLFGLPLGVLLVAVPALLVIIIILKNRKLRKKPNSIFYVNILITDVIAILVQLAILFLYQRQYHCKDIAFGREINSLCH